MSSGYPWWEALFEGYERPVDFDLARLLLAGAGHINYTCLGAYAWPGNRENILLHILAAESWADLFIPWPAASHPRRQPFAS